MKTRQKALVGLGVVAALTVPTAVAVAATGGGDHGREGSHDGSAMIDGGVGHRGMGASAHDDGMDPESTGHDDAGHAGTGHGDMDRGHTGSRMGRHAPAR
ncbi:MAG: hypothetical protein WEB19_01455 [Acidimicrobiia bacterium]